MVADYVNLALLENKFGDTEKAQNNLIIAAEYAEKSGDKDLLQIIEQQLTALK